MTERHVIVYLRDGAWQFTFRGTVNAPFSSRDEAITAAIDEAQALNDPDIEVIVQDADLTEETVWRATKSD